MGGDAWRQPPGTRAAARASSIQTGETGRIPLLAGRGTVDADRYGTPPTAFATSGGHVRSRPGQAELPLDVRRGGARTHDGVLVEAVLDALPSPTLLIDADGKVLLANSAWVNAAEVLDDDRFRIGIGGDYFGLALQVRGDAGTRAMIEKVRELSRGERDLVSTDYALPHPAGTRWYHLQASRVDEAGHIVVTQTDVTSRVEAEQTS